MAYLFYGMSITASEEKKRDVTTRSTARPIPHFQLHQHWAPDGDSTTRHKLLKRAPLNTWVSIGNGTYNGIPHEIHFIRYEDFIGHKVVQNPFLQNSSLPGRLQSRHRVSHHKYFPGTVAYYETNNNNVLNVDSLMGKMDNPPDASEFVGSSVEKASAESGRQDFCPEFALGDETADPGYLVWTAATLNIDASDIQLALAKCRKTIDYVIYARDPLEIDEIQLLLSTYPLANVEEHNSVNGWGMLYWIASLTQAEVADLKRSKQVRQHCTLRCFGHKLKFS